MTPQQELDKMVEGFITSMNEWLEAFNNYADRLIEESKRLRDE